MSQHGRARCVTAASVEVLHRYDFSSNPYLKTLADGSMTLDSFRRSQEQFYFAVAFFPRPMAALLSRLPEPEMRLDVLHNLVEEHGDFHPELFHQNTFRQFLRTIGARADDVRELRPWPALHAFNSVLHSACALDDWEIGACCLGIIELAFAAISAAIGHGVVQRGWVASDDLVHYRLHAEIDGRHAEEFFAVAEPAWDDPRRRALIERGLELGAYSFDRLYRELNAGP